MFDDDSAMSVSSEEDEFHSLIPKLEAQFSEERYGEAQLLEDPFFGKCIMVVRSPFGKMGLGFQIRIDWRPRFWWFEK